MSTPAILLDRDGTLVEPRHYPRSRAELVLYPGLGPGLRRLQAAGWKLALITNQSGVARGLLSEDDLADMHAYLADELAAMDVRLDGVFYCPHHPDGTRAPFNITCGCRKPRPGMLREAARALDLDLGRSWFVGDILDDVEAGNRAGCHTILVDIGSESAPTSALRTPTAVARSTAHALEIVAALSGLAPAADLDYRPARWGAAPALEDLRGVAVGQ